MRSANIDRWFTKPRGYAGDYFTIEMVYEDKAEGDGRLGRFIDRWALDRPAAAAVRNRRSLLTGAIRDVAARFDHAAPVLVTSVASGPARELLDLLAAPDAPSVRATCIDIDNEALAYAATQAGDLGVVDRITFVQDNVIHLSRGRGKTTLAPQHMIYGVGLTEYLADEYVVALLDWMHDQLVPGGTAVTGNFDVSNPTKALMDHVFEWRLIHRTPDQMRELFARSRFADTPVDVRAEGAGVNLFAFGVKRSGAARPTRQTRAFAAVG